MGYWDKDKPDELWMKGISALNGKVDWKRLEADHKLLSTPVVKAFIEDQDLAEMTVVSPCIGFAYTFQKRAP